MYIYAHPPCTDLPLACFQKNLKLVTSSRTFVSMDFLLIIMGGGGFRRAVFYCTTVFKDIPVFKRFKTRAGSKFEDRKFAEYSSL